MTWLFLTVLVSIQLRFFRYTGQVIILFKGIVHPHVYVFKKDLMLLNRKIVTFDKHAKVFRNLFLNFQLVLF
jgi:hypothetical protein